MHKKRSFIRSAISACVILIACALVFGCLSHVLSHDGTKDMYSFFSVQAHFSAFGWVYGALALAIVLLSPFAKKLSHQKTNAGEYKRARETKPRAKGAVRILLLSASAVLIVLGIFNGGLRDVLIKAINICTECIGLG